MPYEELLSILSHATAKYPGIKTITLEVDPLHLFWYTIYLNGGVDGIKISQEFTLKLDHAINDSPEDLRSYVRSSIDYYLKRQNIFKERTIKEKITL